MSLSFRFAILSDPHIALPHTIWDHPSRFHLVEVGIPALDVVFEQLQHQNIDFLLIPGDLTQHGEAENHAWLADRLAQLPYPVFVVPGNHDIIQRHATDRTTGLDDFPLYYKAFGYTNPKQPYYACEVLPGVRLLGLNSIFFDSEGKQIHTGRIDDAQLVWLQKVLDQPSTAVTLVMVHHNVIEHLPGQASSPLGRRYMLENAPELLSILQQAGVQLLFTGHLHVQDIARWHHIHEITTGSLVSYPHPYRVLEFQQDYNHCQLKIISERVTKVPGWLDLQHTSREWMGDRSASFMLKLLTQPPFNIPLSEAEKLAPELRYFWADIAHGDAMFHFPKFPATVNQYFKAFSAIDSIGTHNPIDNNTTLTLRSTISNVLH